MKGTDISLHESGHVQFGEMKTSAKQSRRHRALILGSGYIGQTIARRESLEAELVTLVGRGANPEISEVRYVSSDANHIDQNLLAQHNLIYWCIGGMLPWECEVRPSEGLNSKVRPLEEFFRRLTLPTNARFVFVSSGGTVYGDKGALPILESEEPNPRSVYGLAHLRAESALRELCPSNIIILRVSNVFGPSQPAGRSQGFIANAVHAALRNQSITIFGDGKSQRDFIFEKDFGKFVCCVSRKARIGEIVNIGSGKKTELLEVVREIDRVFQFPVQINFEPARSSDLRVVTLDVSKMKNMCSDSMTSLNSAISQTIRSVRSQNHL